MVYDYVEKTDLNKGYQNPNRNGGNHTFFRDTVIELKFGKKMPYILCILKPFRIMVACLSLKMHGYPHF